MHKINIKISILISFFIAFTWTNCLLINVNGNKNFENYLASEKEYEGTLENGQYFSKSATTNSKIGWKFESSNKNVSITVLGMNDENFINFKANKDYDSKTLSEAKNVGEGDWEVGSEDEWYVVFWNECNKSTYLTYDATFQPVEAAIDYTWVWWVVVGIIAVLGIIVYCKYTSSPKSKPATSSGKKCAMCLNDAGSSPEFIQIEKPNEGTVSKVGKFALQFATGISMKTGFYLCSVCYPKWLDGQPVYILFEEKVYEYRKK